MFYCQKTCGSEDFTIEEWNKVSEDLEETNLSSQEKLDILFPPHCEKQCFDCMAIVGNRQLKTKQMLK